MADNVMGGLGSVAQDAAMEAPEVAAPAAPAAKPGFDDYLEKVRKQQEESFRALDARRQKLLELGSARKNQMFDPQLLAISSALLRPTKTGGFGESLGFATEAMGAEQEKKLQREQAEAKMQMELEQVTQEQKRKMLDDQLMGSLFGGQQQTAQPAMGAPTAAPSAAPTMEPAKSRLDSLTDEQLLALGQAKPDMAKIVMSVIENRRKSQQLGIQEREAKTKEASVKRYLPGVGSVELPMEFWRKLEGAADFNAVSELYKQYNLPINLIDTDEGKKRFMTAEEIGTKTKGEETTTTERAKSSEKARDTILERGDQAPNMINTADAIYSLASDPETSGAFGVLAKPGVRAAIGTAIAEGIRVGNFSVGFPAIEDVIRKIGGTQKEIDAALMAARYAADLELGFRRTFLAGQGSVSNMEAEVTRKLGGGISDSPKIAMAKSEVIKSRALFDQKASEMLQDWEEKNPNKNSYAFKRSPEYKALVEDYSGHLKDLMGKYFQTSGGAPTPSKLAPNRSGKSLLEQIRGQ